MADSNITKQALARALKELMQERSFSKINVLQICEHCNMSRKSFYYHFKDKYDLVNWIFDEDIYGLMAQYTGKRWKFLEIVCAYFYENRGFYRNVMKVHGQNSFSEHFRDVLYPLIHKRLREIVQESPVDPICIQFFADGITCAIERWLLENTERSPKEFANTLKTMVQIVATHYQQRPEDFESERV